jgi:uncharacterized protein (DUF433 family)
MQAAELYPGVVSDPGILGGKPVIKGTRVPVALVLGQLADGVTHEELELEYGVDAEGVKAALGYAARTATTARDCSRGIY